jgi:hypothetical protein
VDREQILNLLPAQAMKKIVIGNSLDAKKNSKEDMRSAIESSNVAKEDLMETLQNFKKEDSPVQFFLIKIEDSRSLDNIRDSLEQNSVELDEDGNTVLEEGFEISENDDDQLKGKYWHFNEKQEINSFGELETQRTDKSTAFRIDLNQNLIYVSGHSFSIAKKLANSLRDAGVETGRIGHRTLLKDVAKEKVDYFVEDLKSQLEEIRENSDDGTTVDNR